MAEFVFDNAFFSVTGTDLSDHVRSATLNYEADAQEKTAMGDNTHQFIGGLKNWSMEVEFNQDFAAGEVDATLFSLVGTTATVLLRPEATGVSATNPNYTGTGLITSYNPMGGSVGDVATTTVSIQPAGDLSRATS